MRATKAPDRPHVFLVLFHSLTQGPLLGSVAVLASCQTIWTVEWDIGTIDEDYQLSDHWFCQDRYERQFVELLQWAADKAHSPSFEIPCATLRWGTAKGMRKSLALRLAKHLLALWEQVLTDWEARPA